MNDLHELHRFIEAQESTYDQALQELREGIKRTHWMWFIFPQLAGLGSSPMAMRYAIRNIEEAAAYLKHPVLGPHLIECAKAVLGVEGKTPREILGTPDDLKLRSSATLFAQVSHQNSVFHWILDRYYGSEPDARTVELLRNQPG